PVLILLLLLLLIIFLIVILLLLLLRPYEADRRPWQPRRQIQKHAAQCRVRSRGQLGQTICDRDAAGPLSRRNRRSHDRRTKSLAADAADLHESQWSKCPGDA